MVIVLDDIHWAERDSFEIIRTILQDTHPGLQLLVVATYRSVPDDHMLWKLIQSIGPPQITKIRLAPFSRKDIGELLAKLVCTEMTIQAKPLVEFVSSITRGNALMINQLFRYLQRQKLFVFDPKLERFTWSDKILELQELNSNAADPWVALKAQLDGLEESQRLVLTTVALLGNTTFDIGIVERVLVPNEESDEGDNHEHCLTALLPLPEHKQREELEKILLQLSEQGLVKQPSDSSNHYGIHDLVLEVAREHLLPDAQEKKALHLILGRRLSALMECSKETGMFLEETLLFNCVNQMNLASSLIQDRWELVDLVNKNYDASEVAALKYSYFSGLKYSDQGMELLRFAWNAGLWPHVETEQRSKSNAFVLWSSGRKHPCGRPNHHPRQNLSRQEVCVPDKTHVPQNGTAR